MKATLLLVVGVILFSSPTLAGEYLMNDTGKTATGLRVVFSEPVTITGFGDALTVVNPEGEAIEFVFSGGEVPTWGGQWLNWEPRTAVITGYTWAVDSDVPPPVVELRPHDPIVIVGDSSFVDPANGVTSGKGTKSDPYVISGWRIDGGSACIYIEETTKYFLIQDCVLNSGGNGILVAHSRNGKIERCVISSTTISSCSSIQMEYNCCGDGICIYGSENVTVHNNIVRICVYSGISLYGSSSCLIEANRVFFNGAEGIELSRNSDENTIAENWVERNGQKGYFGIVVNCNSCGNKILKNSLVANKAGAIRVYPACEEQCSNFIDRNREL